MNLNRRDAEEVVGAPGLQVTGLSGVDVAGDVVGVPDGVDDVGAPGLEETGLTSIEDLVGEMILNGEIDPHAVGLTEEQAQKISHKSR